MAKGVSKELKAEIRKHLRDLVNAEPGSFISTTEGVNSLEYEAMRYLRYIGAFEDVGSGGSGSFRLTAYGREYYEQQTTFAPWYWFKRNWFPAIVAAATFAASVGGIVVNALD